MCMSSPKIDQSRPVQYQEAKAPTPKKSSDTSQPTGMAGGSLLTGPSGAAVQSGNIAGANTLLGN